MHRINPELKEMVVEASQALARLDAERLEELALCCQALNRNIASASDAEREERAWQVRDAVGEMAVFGRVLDATRANLEVMNRVRERRTARLEYEGGGRGPWTVAEKGNGNN